MIDPLKLQHSAFEGLLVVAATTDVDDEVVFGMLLVKVLCYIFDVIAIGLLQDRISRERHGYDAGSDVGEVKTTAFVRKCIFRPCYFLPDPVNHLDQDKQKNDFI